MNTARLLPASLAGRLALILAAGLLLAHGLTFAWVVAERTLAMRGMMADYLVRDLASSIAILERLPAAERAAWLPRLERRNYRVAVPPPGAGAAEASELARQLAAELGPALDGRAVRAAAGADGAQQLHLQLADGTPAAVVLDAPRLRLAPGLLALLSTQFVLLCALAWLAIRQATRPLSALALAADGFSLAGAGAALPQDGPSEVARAARAFNAMQARIHEGLSERTRILAAVSHDLQTPLTRLRLRCEMLEDAPARDKLLRDVDEMQLLVREGISYVRSAETPAEPARLLDLHALLDSLRCDYADAGQAVTLDAPAELRVRVPPQTLRRLLTNLVDNALKFAGAAGIAAGRTAAGGVFIAVRDEGPGIPPGELEAVLQPFYRVEASRNRDTGGAGLGLAIAAQLARGLGGRLVLANRPQRGLEARLELPSQPAGAPAR